LADVQGDSVEFDVVKLERPEELIDNWVPLYLTNELIRVVRTEGKLGLIFRARAHVEGKDIPVQ
jgi:hypothetical protein